MKRSVSGKLIASLIAIGLAAPLTAQSQTSKYQVTETDGDYRDVTIGSAADITAKLTPDCSGILKQGGLVICSTIPGARIETSDGRSEVTADEDGLVVLGLNRRAAETLEVSASLNDKLSGSTTLSIAPRNDTVTEVRGVPCDRLDSRERTSEQQANIERSWLLKQAAWKNFNSGPGPMNGFLMPTQGRISSTFGGYRTYITEGCETRNGRPHFGYDIAAPTGTPIIAPASGTVTLADNDLFFEGGTVFLDHGSGLISVFMHMSSVDVALGDRIEAGALIGEVGSSGTATGPHLHWAVKYRNLGSNDRSTDFYIDPELLLQLPKNAPTE